MRLRIGMAWKELGLRARIAVVVVGLVLAAVAAVFLLKWAPEWLATKRLTGKDRAEEVGRTRTAVLAAVAGLIAVAGAVFTGLSYRLSRAGQITDRFTRAIDQLGSDKLDVRVGGIYALERIARDSADDHPQVIEVLTAYVKQHSPWPTKSSDETPSGTAPAPLEAIRALERIAKGAPIEVTMATPEVAPRQGVSMDDGEPPPDVQAAITVLGRRNVSHDRKGAQLRLSDVDLRGVKIRGGHFENARLRRANLNGAHLEGAHLNGARLEGAHLEGADLAPDTDLELPGANLRGANLQRASLQHADLTEAILQSAELQGADLTGAKIRAANFQHAPYDRVTRWPEGFKPTDHGAQLVERRQHSERQGG